MSALTKELSRSLPPKGDRQDKARGPARQGGSSRAQEQPGKGTGASVPRDERLLFALQALIGHTVQLKVKTGAIYEGVFHTANPEGKDSDIVLKYARLLQDESSRGIESGQPFIKTLKVLWSDFVNIAAKDVNLSAESLAPTGIAADSFSTDAEIGRRRGGLEGRELQRWVPDENDAADGLELTSASQQPGSGKWNQFAVNQKKFGVVTSFNENLYTTRLDKSRSKISEAEADRLAAEIEGQMSGNAHLAEERGMETDDHGDEEARYSSVARPDQHAPTSASASARPLENGAGSAKGVDIPFAAARGQQGEMESGSAPRSQPIDVDPRREHNKVRMQLTGAKVTSPYGTPKSLSRSPLTSPLVGNAVQVQALDLNPGSARFDPDTRKEFQAFKLQQQRGPAEAAQTARGFVAPSSGGPASSAASSADAGTPREAASRQQQEAASRPTSSHSTDAAPGAQLSEAAASRSTPAGANTPAASDAAAPPGSSSSATSADKPKSKLNPFAKSFSFNPAATSFVPGASSRPSTAAPALSNGAAVRPTGVAPVPAGPSGGPPAAAPSPPAGPSVPTGSARPSTSAGHVQNRMYRTGSTASGNSDSPSGPHRDQRNSQRNSTNIPNHNGNTYLNRASSQNGPMSPPRAEAKSGTPVNHMGQQQGQRMGRYMAPQQQQQPPQYMPSARPFLISGPGSPQQTAMFVQRGHALGTVQMPNSAQFLMQPGGIPAFPIMYNPSMGLASVSGQMQGPMFAPSQYGMPMGMSPQVMSQQMMSQQLGSEDFQHQRGHQHSSHGSR